MSKCKSCGGFVTDNYARVFGDNDDDVYDCRNCRSGRGRGESGEESSGGDDDDRTVLLRSVRGEDEEYVSSRGDSTDAGEPSVSGDGAGSEPADATGVEAADAGDGGPRGAIADGGVDAAGDDSRTTAGDTATPSGATTAGDAATASDDAERGAADGEEEEGEADGDRQRSRLGRFLPAFRS